MNLRSFALLLLAAVLPVAAARAQSDAADNNALETSSLHQPFSYGVIFQGGNGLTDNRDGFHFLWAGAQASRVLLNHEGRGILRGNFEYGVQFFPYFQAFTPRLQRVSCTATAGTNAPSCSTPYTVGGTYSGVSLTPIILRWNFVRHGRVEPWVQGAGGVLWTNHKFPAYGNTSTNYAENGPNSDTSVWNFSPQAGVGLHYFTRRNRSIDVSANAVHISSASLGDRNPGVNASVQFSIGYSWWK